MWTSCRDDKLQVQDTHTSTSDARLLKPADQTHRPQSQTFLRALPASKPKAFGVTWLWLKIKQEGQTAGLGPCFHLPGQPILEFRFLETQPHFVLRSRMPQFTSKLVGMSATCLPQGVKEINMKSADQNLLLGYGLALQRSFPTCPLQYETYCANTDSHWPCC